VRARLSPKSRREKRGLSRSWEEGVVKEVDEGESDAVV